jgi:uncharacterized protein
MPKNAFYTEGSSFSKIGLPCCVFFHFLKIYTVMKNSFLTLLLSFVGSMLIAQTAQSDSAFVRDNYSKQEVMIKMRDGVALFTAIYTPKDVSKKYPILLKRTPYTSAPYGDSVFVQSFQNKVLMRELNIFVCQDVRGKWMSEGEFVDVRPVISDRKSSQDIDESTDAYDTAEWLTNNAKGNNGRIGVYGISYPGFYATNALIKGHPAVKAVSPQAPVTDWFVGDDFHHNGALMLMDGFSFYVNFGRPRPKPITKMDSYVDTKVIDNYDFHLKMGALPNYKKQWMGDSIQFWNDLMAHPNMDDFWKKRNIRPHLTNQKAASLVVGGLFDAEDCFGAWRTYEAIEKQNSPSVSSRIVMGPWFHGGWGGRSTGESLGNVNFNSKTSEYFQKEIEAKFFNFYLKDEGKIDDLAEANIFETGSNKWTTYNVWPPKEAQNQNLYLHQNGGLKFVPPSISSMGRGGDALNFAEWVSDPAHPVPYTEDVHSNRTREYMTDDQRFAARRPDVLTFETDVLTEDLTITGTLNANLFFATTGTDADLVVKIIDVFPQDAPQWAGSKVPQGGYEMLVRGEILRGKFRNSFEKPEAYKPNEVTKTVVQLPDIAHSFKKGHRLMVQIQSSWFPLADRNPQQFMNINEAKDSDFKKANHRIYFAPNAASFIALPVKK